MVALFTGALLMAGNSQEPVSTTAKQGSLALPGEKHLRNVRQLTFGGQNAEAYFSADDQPADFSAPRR